MLSCNLPNRYEDNLPYDCIAFNVLLQQITAISGVPCKVT